MTLVDGIILIAFLVYAIFSGLSSQHKASESLEEYFLAGRSLKGWQAGLSMAATQFASDTPLLVTGLIATAGIFAVWQLWIYALSFLLMGFVLAPSWRRSGVITDAELTELRYGNTRATVLRGVKAIYFGTIFNCTVLAFVFFAATKIAEPFLVWYQWLPSELFSPIQELVTWVGIPLTLAAKVDPEQLWVLSTSNFISIFVIVFVTFLYSTTGGLRAVVRTDIAQIFLMLGATAIYAFFVTREVGGLSEMTTLIRERISEFHPQNLSPDQLLAFTPDQAANVTFPLLALFGLQWLIQLNSDGTGYLAQRSMACRSDKDAKVAAIVFTFTQIILRSLLWLPIGLALILLYPFDPTLPAENVTAYREATFVFGMNDYLPAGFKGVMITGMLAALASTVDTHLNWGSSYWTNDIFKRIICEVWLKKEPNPRTLVWVARGSNLLILIIALIIGTQVTSIGAAWQISLLLGAGVGIVLILRWIWWRMNSWGEIYAIVSATILSPVAYFLIEDQATRLLAVAAGSTLAALFAVFHFGPEDRERLVEFYKRARPPGWWGPIAEAVQTGLAQSRVRDLYKRLGATFTCGVSTFCILVGLGSWIADSPAPSFFPWPTL